MTTREFVIFLRPIIIIIVLQHKFLATNSTDVDLKASTWKPIFTRILKKKRGNCMTLLSRESSPWKYTALRQFA